MASNVTDFPSCSYADGMFIKADPDIAGDVPNIEASTQFHLLSLILINGKGSLGLKLNSRYHFHHGFGLPDT